MKKLFLILSIAFFAFSCEKGTPPPAGPNGVLANPGEVVTGGIQGMYLLNEGSAGGNNASLDYYDYSTGRYYRDVFTSRNPGELRLGDTATDIEIYDSKLFIVLNNSNFVDVLGEANAKLIKKIAIPNPRYIAFAGDFAPRMNAIAKFSSRTGDRPEKKAHAPTTPGALKGFPKGITPFGRRRHLFAAIRRWRRTRRPGRICLRRQRSAP